LPRVDKALKKKPGLSVRRKGATMISIDVGQPVVTLINIFTVPAEHQQQLVDVLVEATEETMRHLPGFVSANIHAGLDGTHVANYAQWRSEDDFKAMLGNTKARGHMDGVSALGAKAEPGLYKVVSTHPR